MVHEHCGRYHYIMLVDNTVHLCVCEFIDAGDTREHDNAKFYPSGKNLLTGNSVVSAEIVGHINTVPRY